MNWEDQSVSGTNKRTFALSHGSPEMVNQIVESNPGWRGARLHLAVHNNPAVTPDILEKAWKFPNQRAAVAAHHNATPEQIHRAIHSDVVPVQLAAISNPKCPPEHIEHLLIHPETATRRRTLVAAYVGGHLTSEHIARGKADKLASVANTAEDIEDHKKAGKDPKTIYSYRSIGMHPV